jgi:UrcA family protein
MKYVPSSSTLLTTGLVSILLAAGLAAPAAADVAKSDADFKFSFDFQPEELATPATAEKMLQRLERKVRAECGAANVRTIEDRTLVRTCIDKTMKATISTFGSSTVAEAFQARADG